MIQRSLPAAAGASAFGRADAGGGSAPDFLQCPVAPAVVA